MKKGDCFQVAGKLILDRNDEDNWMLVHAKVDGQGKLTGQKINHAWVEINNFVLDFSNGHSLVIGKEKYYKIANPTHIKKYSIRQAKEEMLRTGKFGSWDE